MQMLSTRGAAAVTPSVAILRGLAPDGGLYVPAAFPHFTLEEIASLASLPYVERAHAVLSRFLPDFSARELTGAIAGAYGTGFDCEAIAPLVRVGTRAHALELWHGPTLAFKDMALQLLPHLLTLSARKNGEQREILILVATSGDTGKAALEGFLDVPGTRCCVFYPGEGVSPAQRLQMITTGGHNTHVIAVNGNFDDAQSGVKRIFADPEFAAKLDAMGKVLSSANSINFGRLVPQVVYYFSAYADLLASGGIAPGDAVNFCVPTGNFGDILAADYARKAGLPVGRLICASNENNVLTDFIRSGKYKTAGRAFHKTMSPSMDILISSNLERLVFELSGRNAALTAERMRDLSQKGCYEISEEERQAMQKEFFASYATEDQTVECIYDLFTEIGYPMDTHTGVAMSVARDYFEKEKDDKRNMVIVSTASPYKFPQDVLYALTGNDVKDSFKGVKRINALTAMAIPASLAGLRDKPVRFRKSVPVADAFKEVLKFLE